MYFDPERQAVEKIDFLVGSWGVGSSRKREVGFIMLIYLLVLVLLLTFASEMWVIYKSSSLRTNRLNNAYQETAP